MTLDPATTAAADYADALLAARRAKRVIALALVLMLLGQVALFLVARYSDVLDKAPLPLAPATGPATSVDVLVYATTATLYLGMILGLMLPLVLLVIVHVMLVGRLIGVAPVVAAFCWSLLLVLLMFPWQSVLNVTDMTRTDFVIPGVFYTWRELHEHADFPSGDGRVAFLKWTRFVVAPAVAVVVLLVVQVRSGRGLRLALGEAVPTAGEQPAPDGR